MHPASDINARRPVVRPANAERAPVTFDFFESPAAALAPFEWYMLVDETTDCPMVFSLILELHGTIDVARWQAAIRQAITVHPLLNACVDQTGGKHQARWKRCHREVELRYFQHADDLPAHWQRFDLANERGFRCAVVANQSARDVQQELPKATQLDLPSDHAVESCGGRTQDPTCSWFLILTFHHAATDGIGARSFAADVVHMYGQLDGSCEVAAVTLRKRRRRKSNDEQIQLALDSRANFPRPNSQQLTWRHKLRVIGKEVWSMLTRRTATLVSRERDAILKLSVPKVSEGVACSPDSSTTDNSYVAFPTALGLAGLRFTHEQTSQFKQTATAAGASLNEFLLAVFCKAVTRYLTAVQGSLPNWITVVAPVHLSREVLRSGQACNAISYAFLHARGEHTQQLRPQMERFAQIFSRLRQTRSPVLFIDTLTRLRRLPSRLSHWVIRGSNPATFVFSYLGESSHQMADDLAFASETATELRHVDLGNCQITSMWGAPPVRRGTELAVAVQLFTDQLLITFRHDQDYLPTDRLRILQELIQQELLQSLSPNSPSC